MKKTIKAVIVTVVGFTLSWQAYGQPAQSPASAQNQPQTAQPAAPANADIQSSQHGAIILQQDTTEQVQIEEYVPKVIIEGKWGTGPGEFGRQMLNDNFYEPTSIAVDSTGDIYILDTVNNRIQKFNNDGKYLLSISVDSFKGKTRYWKGKPIESSYMKGSYSISPTESRGVNIVIDSQDNLYYYCVKKNTGEVWQFKDDKLVGKWDVPIHGGVYYESPLGLFLEDDDSMWIFNVRESGKKTEKHYEIKEKKKYTSKERDKKLGEAKEKYKEQKIKKTTPSDRLKQLDFEVTNEGVRVIRRYETK